MCLLLPLTPPPCAGWSPLHVGHRLFRPKHLVTLVQPLMESPRFLPKTSCQNQTNLFSFEQPMMLSASAHLETGSPFPRTLSCHILMIWCRPLECERQVGKVRLSIPRSSAWCTVGARQIFAKNRSK